MLLVHLFGCIPLPSEEGVTLTYDLSLKEGRQSWVLLREHKKLGTVKSETKLFGKGTNSAMKLGSEIPFDVMKLSLKKASLVCSKVPLLVQSTPRKKDTSLFWPSLMLAYRRLHSVYNAKLSCIRLADHVQIELIK